jgi:ADP-ribose pyrophosphatase YjhB (NUDIX family)
VPQRGHARCCCALAAPGGHVACVHAREETARRETRRGRASADRALRLATSGAASNANAGSASRSLSSWQRSYHARIGRGGNSALTSVDLQLAEDARWLPRQHARPHTFFVPHLEREFSKPAADGGAYSVSGRRAATAAGGC